MIPIALLAFGLEMYFRNVENAFKLKADFQTKNSDKIETIVLGTSHSQNGINPNYFKKLTSNLSFGSQDIQLDSALFFKYVPQMKNLKNVVIELDYHRLDIENEPNYFRFPWYYIYHDIEIYPLKPINKVSLYSSNTEFFNQNLMSNLKSNSKKQVVNSYGFVEENYIDDFFPLNYDSIAIFKSAQERLKGRHVENSSGIRAKNKKRINQIVNFCIKNDLSVFIVSTPLYTTYRNHKSVLKDSYRLSYLDSLKSNTKIKHLDFEESPLFTLKDFSNDDHLNAQGAKKYSLLLNDSINSN